MQLTRQYETHFNNEKVKKPPGLFTTSRKTMCPICLNITTMILFEGMMYHPKKKAVKFLSWPAFSYGGLL